MSDSVKVAVRIRPLIQRERDAEILWTNTERSIQQQKGTGKCAVPYQFDRVFGITETTDDVYKEIAVPIIGGAMLGFNGTIFAYGQTSSGKTFTMMGNEQNPGIIPGVVSEIFDTIENNPEREYLIRVSYLEIYNENITDLLSKEKKSLDVREDTEGKVFVTNLTEELVNNKKQIFKLMAAGDVKRHVGATNMNENSSRSHAIFKIIIESRVRDQEGAVMVSQLNLVDLAGSEKAKATGATGQRLTEGGFINKSLFILGNVISQLSENSPFISYRDSRLTRILQSSLGGNSKTAVICNVSPAALEETHSSLRFATNANRIKNKPVQNEVVSDEAMMQRYKKEIDTLRQELQQTRNLKAGGLLEVNEQLQQQLAAKEAVQAAQEERISRLTALICVSSQMRPTTPGPLTTAAKRKRRETWCPGKAGKGANKPTKSLSTFEETLERDEEYSLKPDSIHKVGFQLPDSSPESLPDLKVDVSRFSNEDMEFVDTGCQTESCETGPSKDRQIQELTAEVENLTKIIDDNLQEVGEAETKFNHEIYATKERLHEVEELNSALREKLAAAEELRTPTEQQLHDAKAEKIKAPVRTSSFGGLELVQQQLEKLRAQLDEKEAVLQEKNREMSNLKAQHNDAVLLVEEVLDEVRDVKAEKDAMRDERDGLKIQIEDVRIQIEKREEEFKEMEEFLTIERDLQNNSIMYRQYGEDMVTELQKQVAVLEKTSRDSQALLVDLNKQLATSNTQVHDLQLKLNTTENELKQLTNEKADFEMYQDLEREKHKRRQTELTAQLEEAYREISELRSAAGTSVMGQSLDMSLQAALACHVGGGGNLEASMAAADNLQVEQLNAQVADLQDQLSRLQSEQGERAGLETERLILENDKQDHEKERAALSEEKTGLEQEKTGLEQEKTSLEQEKTSLEQEKTSLEQEKTSLEQEKTSLEQEKITFNAEKQELQQKLSGEEEDKSAVQQQKAVLAEEKDILEQEKTTLEEEKLKVQGEQVVIEEAKKSLETEWKTLDSDKLELKNLKEDLEEDRLAFEEEKIMEKEIKESVMEEERKQFEERIEELQEEIRQLEKKREEIDTERVKSCEKSDDGDNDTLALEKELIAKEKESIEEQQNTLEEMLTCLEEERNAFDVDKKALDEKKLKQSTLEEERNMLQLEKRAMDEHIAVLEIEIKSLKEERDSQQEITSSSEDIEQYRDKMAALEQQLEDAKKEFEEEKEVEKRAMDEHIAVLEIEIKSLKEERDSQQEITSSSDDIEQYKAKIATLEQQLEDAKKEFEEEKEQLQKEGGTSEEEKKALEKELGDLKKTYEEEKESQISDKEKEALLKELDELKKAAADEKEMLEKENGLSEQERQLLEEENKTLEEERKSLEVESQKTAEEYEALKDTLNGLEEERNDLLAQLQKAHDEIVQLKEELSQLRSESSEQREQIAEEEIERREAALSDLRGELEAQREADKEAAEKALQEQILAIQAEAMAKLEEAKTMLPAADLDETGMMGAEVQLEMARAELERLKARSKQREVDLQEKLDTIMKLGTTIQCLEEKKEEDHETIQTLHEQIEDLKHGTEAIVIEVKEERDAAWNTIKEMQEELDRLTKREEELEQQVELHTEELEQLNECVSEQHAELAKEHEQVATLEDQLMELKERLAFADQERDSERKLIDEANTELEQLKKEKEQSESEFRRNITELEDQLSTSTAGTNSTQEVAKLEADLQDYKERLAFAIQERDSKRQLMDEADEESEQLKEEKERNESAFKKKIAQLEERLSTSTAGRNSTPEMAKLEAALQDYKERFEFAVQERDSERKLMDEADDELKQLKEEKERNESAFKKKIAHLEERISTSMAGRNSTQEVAKLEAALQDYKGRFEFAVQERDSQRKLMDEADDESEQLKEEKERNESAFKKKIAQLEERLSTSTAGRNSTPEVAKLEAALQKYKEHFELAVQERDSERKLMDEADDELKQLKEEKERNESAFKKKIDQLEERLSTSTAGRNSTQEVAKLEAALQDYKERFEFVDQERDSQRKLMDEADDESEQLKEEKERNESAFKKKIAQLEERLSTSTAGRNSTPEVAKLEAALQDYKERLEFAVQERDSERKLMDEADDELKQLKGEKENSESALKKKIAQLEATLAKVHHGAATMDETKEMSALKTKLARTEIQERRLKENAGVLESEIRSYKERLNGMRSEIRRLQNQITDTSFMPNQQQGGRSLPTARAPAPVSAPAEAIGIVGSVKVLALESENAHLERELKRVKKQLHEEQTYRKREDCLTENRTLKSLPNGASPAKAPAVKRKVDHDTAEVPAGSMGATAGATKSAPGTTAMEDPYAAQFDISTYGALLEDDPYVALTGAPNNVIRDLYLPLFRKSPKPKPAAKEEVEGCNQQ